jgi:biotin carboxylase
VVKKKTVLVINVGWEQQPLIEEVLSQGYRVVGIQISDSGQSSVAIDVVKRFNVRDISGILQFAKELQPDAVLSDQCDYSYFATALVAEALSLPGPRIAQAQLTTNKWLQREQLSQSGLLQPRYKLCASISEAQAAAEYIGFPVIFKPLDNRGSFGVGKVEKYDDINSAYTEALTNSYSRLILVEEFIEGTQITIDGYIFPEQGHKSLTLATKEMIQSDRQVAMEIVYPGELSAEIHTKAMNNNNRVVESLGLTFGMTHAEYMITSEGDCYLIEIANRGGGVFTSAKIVPAVTGLDITKQLVFDSCATARDLFIESDSILARSAVLSFLSFAPGKIELVCGLDGVRTLPGVEAVRLDFSVGDIISAITTDGDRHGFVIVSHDDLQSAKQIVENVKNTIKVTYAT